MFWGTIWGPVLGPQTPRVWRQRGARGTLRQHRRGDRHQPENPSVVSVPYFTGSRSARPRLGPQARDGGFAVHRRRRRECPRLASGNPIGCRRLVHKTAYSCLPQSKPAPVVVQRDPEKLGDSPHLPQGVVAPDPHERLVVRAPEADDHREIVNRPYVVPRHFQITMATPPALPGPYCAIGNLQPYRACREKKEKEKEHRTHERGHRLNRLVNRKVGETDGDTQTPYECEGDYDAQPPAPRPDRHSPAIGPGSVGDHVSRLSHRDRIRRRLRKPYSASRRRRQQ